MVRDQSEVVVALGSVWNAEPVTVVIVDVQDVLGLADFACHVFAVLTAGNKTLARKRMRIDEAIK